MTHPADPDRIVFERQHRAPDVEAMEREITKLAAHINAATYRLLVLIAEVAHALVSLPLISDAFARGEASYSKVRAMTRVATPENEGYLLMIARHGTASHVEKLVRAYRGVLRVEEAARAQKQHAERSVVWLPCDDGSVLIQARLPAEQADLVMKALESIRAKLDSEHGDAERDVSAETSGCSVRIPLEPFSARRADALVEWISRWRSTR